MPVEFKSLSMMDLRSRPGEVLDDVARQGQAFVIERNGQQKACLVPISFFLPDIQSNRLAAELAKLDDANEQYRMSVTDTHEIQLQFGEMSGDSDVNVTVTLPHGYPNNSPIVSADPIKEGCPHRWQDGTLCLYGAMDTWNPGKHDMLAVLDLCRRWMVHYQSWRKEGQWPTDGDHVER